MPSSVLNRASRSSRLRRAVEAFPPTRRVVDRFVAGETVADAVNVAQRLSARGMTTTIDVLGEDTADAADAADSRAAYLNLLHGLETAGVANGGDVSLKLSAIGQALPGQGQEIAVRHARAICEAASGMGASVSLDMEDHTTVDSSLSVAAELRKDFMDTTTVLQSNLYRTERDIQSLADSKARIRLVKGAYNEPASVAYQRKSDVDTAYTRGIRALMSSTCYPMIATHDPRMVQVAIEAAAAAGRGSADWELQMLYGIAPELQRQLRASGHRMRIYVPFGADWYAYFMRRLAERPANVAFFARALVRS